MHSTHSYDGKLPLRELRDFLQKRGIQFACMTEHTDKLNKEAAGKFVSECRELSDDEFVFVPGFEVPYKNAHVLHIGVAEFVCDFADADQIKQWREKSPLVILAHPVRNKFAVDETLLECIDGVEIWNQQYEGKLVPRTRSVKLLSQLRQQKPLLATGGIDFHRIEHFGSPLVTVESGSLSEETIINLLKAGEFHFGHDGIQIGAKENWQPTKQQTNTSRKSVLVINFGKLVNKVLFNLGLSLPKNLKQSVRSRV